MELEERIGFLLDQRPIPITEYLEEVAGAATRKNNEEFEVIVRLSRLAKTFDHPLAYPALYALPAWGIKGINVLTDNIYSDRKYPARSFYLLLIIAAELQLSVITTMFIPDNWYEKCEIEFTNEIIYQAKTAVREIILAQSTDHYLLFRLSSWITNAIISTKGDDANPVIDYWITELTGTKLLINKNLLGEFEDLTQSDDYSEEDLHQFLFNNPVFLDPLAVEIWSKHELGSEFITDFIVKRLNNEYVLVEIEKPTDKIFTNSGSYRAKLRHAEKQVKDFQTWTHDNLQYARNKLPNINHPEGLLIIGRRSDLNPSQIRSLDEENFSRRGHLKIITFDDLLDQAKIIYHNLLTKPILYKGAKLLKE